MKNNKQKGAIYTCITGGYDTLINHTYMDPDWDYVCFTDDLSIGTAANSHWQIRPLLFDKLDDVRNQRWHKIHPHLLFPEHEKSIWLDANMDILNKDPFADMDRAIDESRLISLSPHPGRNCIYDELLACVKLGKDDETVMKKQVDLIRSEGFPERNGLFESNIIYRHHHHDRVINVMKDWWWWIEHYSRRDQLSLTYVLWQHKFEVRPLTNISYRYHDGIAFLNNANHVTKEELIVQRDQLQQEVSARDREIARLNQAVKDLESRIMLLALEQNKITSQRSRSIMMPLRLIGRLIRGDWSSLRASIPSLKIKPKWE
ncbi:MAG: DUF616 domain-containing protein [Deltaproteobacteria bacterium]|nr:DUF616 domain-containing protein [Deltaproteobacteria bacterium]